MTQMTAPLNRIADDYGTAALVVGVLLVFGMLPFGADFLGYSTNIYTKLISVAVTILILDRRAQRRDEERRAEEKARDEQHQREERIARVIREMRGKDYALALRAVEEAHEIGIMRDGTLENVDLTEANLKHAYLGYANLSDAYLARAELSNAYLEEANLPRVYFVSANLKGAVLERANLSDANMEYVNLSGADLMEANLNGTNLRGANLTGANLWDAILDEKTILPDSHLEHYGDGSKRISIPWTPDTDLTRYTNSKHPDFWQPEYAAAGFDTFLEWMRDGNPRPWVDAGYSKNKWNEWVRDGKPAHKPDPEA